MLMLAKCISITLVQLGIPHSSIITQIIHTLIISCCLLQAYGMGAYEALPVIFQRTSMLMLAHCIPITLVQLAVPELLRVAGEDPDLCRLASAYAIRLLPSLYIEALSR